MSRELRKNSIADVNFAISARSEQPEDGLLQRRGYTSEWIRRCLQAHLDRTRASNLQQTMHPEILERQQAGTWYTEPQAEVMPDDL